LDADDDEGGHTIGLDYSNIQLGMKTPFLYF
jgi:hypothetical protein